MSTIDACPQKRLGTNTDFETNSALAGQVSNLTSLDGWSLADGATEFRVAKSVTDLPSASGNSSVLLDNAVGAKGLSQKFDTTPDSYYQVEFNLALLADRIANSPFGSVLVYWAGKIVSAVTTKVTEWDLFRFDAQSSSASTSLELRLSDSSAAIRIDNVAVYKKPAIGSGLNNGDELTGGNSGDRINGDALDDTLYGGTGNDTIYGGTSGFDQLYGGGGNDLLYGGSGYDRLYGGTGEDTLYGGSDRDLLYGGADNDHLYGGDGRDLLYGGAGNDVMYGDGGNDSLDGGAGSDTIYGGDGNDTLTGGNSNDPTATNELYGGAGNDVFYAGSETDHYYGGAGIDTVSYERSRIGLKINATDALASTGIAFGDIFSDDVEIIKGTRYSDDIYGTVGPNNLQGLAGNDTLTGGNSNDTLYGGTGDDVLVGGFGDNLLYGGAGNDTFVFNFTSVQSHDTIADFVQGQDKIKFTHDAGFEAASFAKLLIELSGNDTLVKYTTSVTGYQSTIKIANFKQALVANDFIFE